jgi:hypothetical protein
MLYLVCFSMSSGCACVAARRSTRHRTHMKQRQGHNFTHTNIQWPLWLSAAVGFEV